DATVLNSPPGCAFWTSYFLPFQTTCDCPLSSSACRMTVPGSYLPQISAMLIFAGVPGMAPLCAGIFDGCGFGAAAGASDESPSSAPLRESSFFLAFLYISESLGSFSTASFTYSCCSGFKLFHCLASRFFTASTVWLTQGFLEDRSSWREPFLMNFPSLPRGWSSGFHFAEAATSAASPGSSSGTGTSRVSPSSCTLIISYEYRTLQRQLQMSPTSNGSPGTGTLGAIKNESPTANGSSSSRRWPSASRCHDRTLSSCRDCHVRVTTTTPLSTSEANCVCVADWTAA